MKAYPRTLAAACLAEADPAAKCELTARAANEIAQASELDLDTDRLPVNPIGEPGRPARPLLVPPRELVQRKLRSAAGRAALIHAVAHIEFNAINLAWDAVYRFPAMPADYYRDWASVAADEARHFLLLQQRLRELGHDYGDFPAHDGLWSMALATADDVLVRMALVPRVLEARGLDVTPGMIERLRAAGDEQTIACLEIILREEVRHVEIGSRWFHDLCAQRGLEPEATFLGLLDSRGAALIRPPINLEARGRAGFGPTELAAIVERAGIAG
jgi:uncharacterized ferritin-like protein (DUF455 family)